MKRFLALFLAVAMVLPMATGCKNGDDEDAEATAEATAQETEEDSSANDAAESTAFVAMMGDQKVYDSEFYYFLYQGIRKIYYEADIYDETLTEDENKEKLIEFFNSVNEDGVLNMQLAVDETLSITQGFYAAYLMGKAAAEKNADYEVSEDYIEQMNSYIDSEADYGATVYDCTRDEYFFYLYGMNVNDAKRYTVEQMYAETHETAWADENGFTIGMDEPEEPEAPTAPDSDADDETKATYEQELAEYNTNLETYNAEVEKYEAAREAYYDKFRSEYELNESSYRINTVRYLYVSVYNDEGELLSDEEIEAKKATAENCMWLVKNGQPFENIVKGYSESDTVATDEGLYDIDLYSDDDLTLDDSVLSWAIQQNTLSTDPVLIEGEDGFYVVEIVGITNYDETQGITANDTVTFETVRSNVEYYYLAELYNDFIEEKLTEDDYKLTEINNDLMLELATKYLEYDTSAFEEE